MVKVCPVKGTFVTVGVIPVEFAISSRSVPAPVPVLAVTVQAVPEPDTDEMLSPVNVFPTSTRLKLLAVTPVTDAANVTSQVTVVPEIVLHKGFAPDVLIEETVVDDGEVVSVNVTLRRVPVSAAALSPT